MIHCDNVLHQMCNSQILGGMQEVGDAMLPSDVHHVFFEVLQYVARCKLAILAAIKHAFCGVLTLEIAKVLAPAASTKQSRLSGFSLVRTLSDTLGISSEPAGRATNDSLPAVLEDSNFPEASKEAFRMTFNMGRNPIMHGANNGSSKSAGTASSQQIQKASSEGLLDSAALGGLLEIIDREFQVCHLLSFFSIDSISSCGTETSLIFIYSLIITQDH